MAYVSLSLTGQARWPWDLPPCNFLKKNATGNRGHPQPWVGSLGSGHLQQRCSSTPPTAKSAYLECIPQ